jgi:uncharacterized membrane-anchored protein
LHSSYLVRGAVSRGRFAAALAVALVGPAMIGARARASTAEKAEPAAAAGQPTESQRAFDSIAWTKGPAKVNVGGQAEMQVPQGFAFTGPDGARKLLELMHNPTAGSELGILTDAELGMFVLFEFEDIGYVKDADKEKLDADDMLDSIREGNESANEARKERGWPPIQIVGWHTPPFYNPQTNNLEWCIKGESQGRTIINYNTRILGRAGVMSANLMVDPEKLGATLPVVKNLLGGFSYIEGKRYAQYLPGDKVAKYGLTALVVGGAVGVAAKTGFLAKIIASMGKLWKALIVGLIAVGAALKKFVFGRKKSQDDVPASYPPPQQGG